MPKPSPAAVTIAGTVVTVALVAVFVALALIQGPDEEVVVEPTATPTSEQTPEPTAEPTEPEPEPPPRAEPFDVRLVEADGLHVVSTDNAPILSRDSLPVDERVAEDAAEIARAQLAAFLDTQFTEPDTWFGDEAVEALLTPRARDTLDDEDRRALGRIDLDVDHVITGEAEADAMITMHGDRPRSVTLTFDATLTVVAADGTDTPLRLAGVMVFVPTEDGWLVEAVDATLTEEAA